MWFRTMLMVDAAGVEPASATAYHRFIEFINSGNGREGTGCARPAYDARVPKVMAVIIKPPTSPPDTPRPDDKYRGNDRIDRFLRRSAIP